MIRLIWTRILLLSLAILLLLSTAYFMAGSPPPLRPRGGGGGGALKGYRDCRPAQQVVLLQHGPSDRYSFLLEEILTKFAVQHQLTRDRQTDGKCNIFFLGISPASVNCTNLAGLRQSVGEQTYYFS